MENELVATTDLIRACLDTGNEAAWAAFIARFHRVIASTVVRTCRMHSTTSPEVIDDLIQDTYLKLCAHGCRILADFKETHPDAIFGFLKTIAYSVVQDHFRGARASKRGSARDHLSLSDSLPATTNTGPAQVDQALFIADIERRLTPFSPHEKWMFWLYFRQGLTAKAISELPGIALTSKGVESAIHRMTRHLRGGLFGPPKGNA